MEQLILHLFGDYVTQSNWMAQNKGKRFDPAFVHALIYSLPFLLIGSERAWLVILVTHFLIDRYQLARFVVIGKNLFFDPEFWRNHNRHIFAHVIPKYQTATGYPSETPAFLSVWLLIAADNTIHLAINYAAIRWL